MRRRAELENRRNVLEAKIAAMRAEYEEELHVLENELDREGSRIESTGRNFAELASRRGVFGRDDE